MAMQSAVAAMDVRFGFMALLVRNGNQQKIFTRQFDSDTGAGGGIGPSAAFQ